MKTQIFKIILLSAIMFSSAILVKADYTKNIHKSWPLNKVKSLSVENKFGNINFINTRDDSVTIDVTVTIKGASSGKAAQLADRIEFDFSNDEGKVKAETIFEDDFKSNGEFSVSYTINIPINKFIDVENKFGNVTLGDLKSGGKFEVSYGNIHGKTLYAPSNEMIDLELKYGNATFEKINSMDAEIQYSNFNAEAIDNADFNTRYSTIGIQKCHKLICDSQFDNYTIENTDILDIVSKFTAWKVYNLKTKLELENEYGDIYVKHISPEFEKVNIDNDFGNIKVIIDPDASYYLKGEVQFCDLKRPKVEAKKLIKDDFGLYIEGVVGKGTPAANVTVKSKYGKVDLME